MKNLIIIIFILTTLQFPFKIIAQGQPSSTTMSADIAENNSSPPKGNLTCKFYSYELTIKFFNSENDVEDFLSKNTKTPCSFRRNNGNIQFEFKNFDQFRRIEIKNSTIATLPAKFFSNFSRLNIFRARSVNIQQIQMNDFEASDNVIFIDLSRNEIKKLENSVFTYLKAIKEIDLSFNHIDSIDDSAFDNLGRNLTRVDLSNNEIKAFKEDFFLNMIVNVSRKWLPFDVNLRNNEIEKIEPSQREPIIFPEINLDLTGNKMKELELLKIEIYEITLNNHSLTYINVNASQISADSNMLNKLRIKGKTRMLSVRNNQISELSFDDHLSILKNLYISGNNLSSDNFYDLSRKIINVEILDISNNPLNTLKIDTFSEMSRLNKLFMSAIGIVEISFGLFGYQQNLRYLDVSNNNLSEIDFHVFSSLPALENLDVGGTNISRIFYCRKIKELLPKLTWIGLENNNFKCDSLSRLKICLNSQGIKIMQTGNSVKNESNIAGIKCYTYLSTTTTTTIVSSSDIQSTVSTTVTVHEKQSDSTVKINQTKDETIRSDEKSTSNGSTSLLELTLSIVFSIAITLLIIFVVVKIKDYYKCNRIRMPRFGRRNSPDTIISYDSSLDR